MIKLQPPVNNFTFRASLSQSFGVNAAIYQARGLFAHDGLDIDFPNILNQGYGQPILAAHQGYISQLIQDNPEHTRGNGLCVMANDQTYMTLYWHLSKFNVGIGQVVNVGDVIGFAGNTGFVMPAPSPSNPYAGTHLHFGLKIFGIVNQYNSYIDPIPRLYNLGDKLPFGFTVDMLLGSIGNQVSWLQTMMKLEGYADYEPIGYFGLKTMRDVKHFQEMNGINPVFGYVGSKTRAALFTKYVI